MLSSLVSIVSGIIILLLIFSETSSYFKVATTDHIVVDTTFAEKLQINFNITFHSLTCRGDDDNDALYLFFFPFIFTICCLKTRIILYLVFKDVNMDAMDVSGDQQLNVDHTLMKVCGPPCCHSRSAAPSYFVYALNIHSAASEQVWAPYICCV